MNTTMNPDLLRERHARLAPLRPAQPGRFRPRRALDTAPHRHRRERTAPGCSLKRRLDDARLGVTSNRSSRRLIDLRTGHRQNRPAPSSHELFTLGQVPQARPPTTCAPWTHDGIGKTHARQKPYPHRRHFASFTARFTTASDMLHVPRRPGLRFFLVARRLRRYTQPACPLYRRARLSSPMTTAMPTVLFEVGHAPISEPLHYPHHATNRFGEWNDVFPKRRLCASPSWRPPHPPHRTRSPWKATAIDLKRPFRNAAEQKTKKRSAQRSKNRNQLDAVTTTRSQTSRRLHRLSVNTFNQLPRFSRRVHYRFFPPIYGPCT